jgi:hypothetical protein
MPIIVEPRECELAVAHEGRRMLVLGCRSRAEHFKQIQTAALAQGITWPVPRLHLLALTCNVQPHAYAVSHSMLPSLRVATKASDTKHHGSADTINLSRRLGMLTQRAGAYVCPACIEEDVGGTYKHSWFRREHHLVGVDWCPSHHIALHRVEDPNPFDNVPQSWLNEGRTTRLQTDHHHMLEGGFIARYVAIAVTLLNRSRPVSCTALNLAISEKAKALGLRVSETGQRPLLSDRLIKMADAGWLQRHLPGIAGKPKGQVFRRIDMVASNQSVPGTGDAYAFALATLFDSCDEAMRTVLSADTAKNAGGATLNKHAAKRRGNDFWHGQIWMQYLQCDGSHAELARRFGMDRSHLTTKLNSMGLPSLSGLENSPKWRAILRFSDGASIEEACAAEQVETKTLNDLIRTCAVRAVTAARSILAQHRPSGHLAHSEGPLPENQEDPTGPNQRPGQPAQKLPVHLLQPEKDSARDLCSSTPLSHLGDSGARKGKPVKTAQTPLQLGHRVAEV